MFVIAYKPGQLCNRLLQYATFIAFSERTGLSVMNLSLDEYAHLFVGTSQDPLCRYPPRRFRWQAGRWFRRFLFHVAYYSARLIVRSGVRFRRVRIVSLDWDESLFLDDDFLQNIQGAWFVFVQGWRIMVPPVDELEWCGPPGGIEPQAEVIREYFTPQAEYLEEIDKLVSRAREGCDRLIGVHIRQGDFLTDKNQGRYYYETKQYVEKMREIRKLYPDERVHFLVCSDVEQHQEAFEDLPCAIGGRDPVVDLYSLARCDAIIGPPSSFSLWAAFYGNADLYWIFDIGQPVRRESFAPYAPVDQDKYAEQFHGYEDAQFGASKIV